MPETSPGLRRKLVNAGLYILFLLILFEGAARAFWSIARGAPFFSTDQFLRALYQEMAELDNKRISDEDGYFDILFLAGSVPNKEWGTIEQHLQAKLAVRSGPPVRIHNLSWAGRTSRDSYFKYRHLQKVHFDLVVFYHAINETRANNAPSSVFREDYTHYSWYEIVQEYENNTNVPIFVLPNSLYTLWVKGKELIGVTPYLPTSLPRAEWLEHGSEIKTSTSFRQNLRMIIELARKKGETVLLMTFAFYVPDDYSFERFQSGVLDYGTHLSPIETWGKKDNVVLGIVTHNKIITELAGEFSTLLVDQNRLIPKNGRFFNDICHLTDSGCDIFAGNMVEVIAPLINSQPIRISPDPNNMTNKR